MKPNTDAFERLLTAMTDSEREHIRPRLLTIAHRELESQNRKSLRKKQPSKFNESKSTNDAEEFELLLGRLFSGNVEDWLLCYRISSETSKLAMTTLLKNENVKNAALSPAALSESTLGWRAYQVRSTLSPEKPKNKDGSLDMRFDVNNGKSALK